jgi:hypothetical protein
MLIDSSLPNLLSEYGDDQSINISLQDKILKKEQEVFWEWRKKELNYLIK